MLIIKIFIDDMQIDEIGIQRKERILDAKRADTYRYEIKGPVRKTIRHSQGFGWVPLLRKALAALPGGYGRKPYMGSKAREIETTRGKLRHKRPRLPGVRKVPAGWTRADALLMQEAEASADLVKFFEPKDAHE